MLSRDPLGHVCAMRAMRAMCGIMVDFVVRFIHIELNISLSSERRNHCSSAHGNGAV